MAIKGLAPKERFEKLFRVTPGCWPWIGATAMRYGSFHLGRKKCIASRFSYELYVGEIPNGLWVLHRCDNPSCVNPDHLFLGTQRDNMADCSEKGRIKITHHSGSRHGAAKLTGDQVTAIRADDRLHTQIAADYGISRSHVGNLKSARKWASL